MDTISTIIGNGILLVIILGPLSLVMAPLMIDKDDSDASQEVQDRIKKHNFIDYSREAHNLKLEAASLRKKKKC